MQVKVLIDNRPDESGTLAAEHGLSVIFEVKGSHFLLDTGLTGLAMKNAERMGVDLSTVETLILSHGHVDHTGGLAAFLERNQKAKVYLSRRIGDWIYFSNHHGHRHTLSPDRILWMKAAERFYWLDADYWLTNEICLVTNRSGLFSRPAGNSFLSVSDEAGKETSYDGGDEVSVAVTNEGAFKVLASCSHSGCRNIIDACRRATGLQEVSAYFGGLHLLDDAKGEKEARTLAEALRDTEGRMDLYVGHCTGQKAQAVLKEVLGERCHVFCTGSLLNI